MLKQAIPKFAEFSTMNSNIVHEIEGIYNQPTPNQEELSALLKTRKELAQTRGLRALQAIRQRVSRNIGRRLPKWFVAGLNAAIELIEQHRLSAAAVQVAKAVELLVNEIEYDHLVLQDAALVACLISGLIEFADELTANRVEELSHHCHGAMADGAVSEVAFQDGKLESLVPLLTEVFSSYREKLGTPKKVSACRLRTLLTENVLWGDLPGICIATWAATNGHLASLSKAIEDGMASKIAERDQGYDPESQTYAVC